MLKYYNAMVVFEEIPKEISLAINITNCPCHCVGCHSKFLWEDTGIDLTTDELDRLIDKNDGITAICLMGGDIAPSIVSALAEYIHEVRHLKVGWYSGMDELCKDVNLNYFDYVKIGHYDYKVGGLDKTTTNQRLYEVIHDENNKLNDITKMFWKKKVD